MGMSVHSAFSNIMPTGIDIILPHPALIDSINWHIFIWKYKSILIPFSLPSSDSLVTNIDSHYHVFWFSPSHDVCNFFILWASISCPFH